MKDCLRSKDEKAREKAEKKAKWKANAAAVATEPVAADQELNNIPIPGIKYLRHMMTKRIPVPQLFKSDAYRLWTDRYYIAFQPLTDDDAPVMYVYLSKAHITEELSADLKARQRGHEGFLDASTRAQFAAAWRALAGSRMGYATRELKPTPRPQSPLDLKAPWRCGCPRNEETAPASRRERR